MSGQDRRPPALYEFEVADIVTGDAYIVVQPDLFEGLEAEAAER